MKNSAPIGKSSGKRTILVLVAISILLLLLGLSLGAYVLMPWQFWEGNALHPLANLRFCRMLTAFFVGGSLGLSGLLLQGVFRNPLAEPFTLGISGGGCVGAAAVILLGLQGVWWGFLPLGALVGALLVLTIVLWLCHQNTIGINSTGKMLLTGVMAGTLASNLLMLLITFCNNDQLAGITWWMLGDMSSAPSSLLWLSIPLSLLILGCCFHYADLLDVLSLGEEKAFSLGKNPRQTQRWFVLASAILASVTICMVGIIGFVGLIIPHAGRSLWGYRSRRNMLPVFLLSGNFLMLCDILSRCILPPRELPIGVITSLLGGPLFLWILNRTRRPH